ncbi:hypothetical protein RZS08_57195, partial [Arthrospira platensis SPKY1]|nr:hypothetical protein [Arthrospira platensis SPKY1]
DVFGLGPLSPPADMAVQINETRQGVHAFGIQLTTAFLELGAILRLDGHARIAHRGHPRDAVAFDHDIDGPAGRGAIAVDERHAPDDELLEGALAFLPVGGGRHLG